MDETTRTRISIVCLGLIVTAIGVYLTFSYLSAGTWGIYLSGIPIFVGLTIIWYGYDYNPKNKPVKRQKPHFGSDTGQKVFLTGIIMFPMGLGLVFLGASELSGSLVIGAFLFSFVGFILIIVGSMMHATERKKQDSSASSCPTIF
jgi:uncharacterized membrane protein